MTRAETWLAAWWRFLDRSGLVPSIGLVALSVVSAFYAKDHLGLNTKTAEMFPPDLPFRLAKERLNAEFPRQNNRIIAVLEFGGPEKNRAIAGEFAARLMEREETIGEVFYHEREDFLIRHGLLYSDVGELDAYADRLSEAQPFLAGLVRDPSLRGLFGRLAQALTREEAPDPAALDRFLAATGEAMDASVAGEPHTFSWQGFLREDGGDRPPALLLFINPRMDFSRLLPAGEAMRAVREAAEEVMAATDTPGRIRFTGDVALAYEEMRAAKEGSLRAAPLAFGLVAVLLFIGLRSPRLIAASLLTLACGLALTAGLAALLVGSLNMISLAFAVLYIGLGVDHAVHFSLYYRGRIRSGAPNRAALEDTIRKIGPALALCSATTALGFFVFLFTDFQGVSELGIIAGSGMLVSLLVSLTLLPIFLRFFPVRARPRAGRGRSTHSRLGRLSRLPEDHARAIRAASLALGAAALLALPRVAFDPDPLNLRDRGSESVETLFDLIDRDRVSPWTVELLVDDPGQAREAAARLEEIEGVGRVVSLHSLVPSDQDEKLERIALLDLILGNLFVAPLDRDPEVTAAERAEALFEFREALARSAAARTPARERFAESLDRFLSELASRPPAERDRLLLRLEKGLLETFPAAMENLRLSLTADFVGPDDLPAGIARRWVNEAGVHRIQVLPDPEIRSRADLRAFARNIRAEFPEATGDLIVNLESGAVVTDAFREAFFYALAAILLLLAVHTRSWRETGLVLLPLALATAFTGAAMAASGIPLNFANIIALPLLLGYGIDNGIHVIHRRRQMAPGEPFLATSTARAALLATLTTTASFGTLAFSPHAGTASMGIVLTLGLAFILLTTLLVLPAFLAARR